MSPRSQGSVRDAFRSAEISQILAEFFLGEILFKHIFVHNNQCEFFALSAGPFYALIVRLFTKKKKRFERVVGKRSRNFDGDDWTL